jgi:hypothetical protein
MPRMETLYVPAYVDLAEHPKVYRAVAALNVDEVQVVGHLIYLWWWVMKYAPDGDLSSFSAVEIARAGRWKGHAGTFVDALQMAGFLTDGAIVNGWGEYGGKVLHARKKDADRKKAARSADVQGVSEDTPRMSDVRVEKSREEKNKPLAPPAAARSRYPKDFEAFWVEFPLHRGKDGALRAWKKARARGISNDDLIAGAKAYADDPTRDPTKTKYAQGWLNDGRWQDEHLSPNGHPSDPCPVCEIDRAGWSARSREIHAEEHE